MLFVLGWPLRYRMLDYMNMSYFGNDYFEAGDDPALHFLLQQYPQRKPSYEEILPSLSLQEEANPLSQATCDSPKPRPQDILETPTPEKKNKKRRENAKTLGQGIQRGHWNIDENKRYHWFLELYSQHFLNKQMRRMDKIFKTMEKFIGSREAEQCRSHHQKMEKKHGSFIKILKELRKTHYGCGDADPVSFDMKNNGLQCTEELLSWAELEAEVVEKTEESESSRETVNEIVAPSVPIEVFIDPFEQFQFEGDQFIENFIN